MRISINNFQHDCLETIHNLLKSNTGPWAKVRKRPSSAANFSPPRPSNAGVAFAELRQTKEIKNQIPDRTFTKVTIQTKILPIDEKLYFAISRRFWKRSVYLDFYAR